MFGALKACEFRAALHALKLDLFETINNVRTDVMAAIDDLKQIALDMSAQIDAENTTLKAVEDKLTAAIAAGNQDPAIAEAVASLQASRQRSADATAAANALLNPAPPAPAA